MHGHSATRLPVMGAHALSACRKLLAMQLLLCSMFHWSASAETLPVHTSAMVDISVHADGQLEQLEQLEHLESEMHTGSAKARADTDVSAFTVGESEDVREEEVGCEGKSSKEVGTGCTHELPHVPPPQSFLGYVADHVWQHWLPHGVVSGFRDRFRSLLEQSKASRQNFVQPQWMRSVWGPLTGGGASSDEPQVFFLFMTASGMDRPELWEAFFKTAASHSQYRVLMHCSSPGAGMCGAEMLARYKSMGIIVVDTVPTYYCKDLVSGMVQLVRKALPLSQSSRDKFVFLSESTLPVKPFGTVYQTLTGDERSDFCIMPSEHWVKVGARDPKAKDAKPGRLIKHHQWFVLSRGNAKTLTERWTGDNERYSSDRWSVPVCEGDCVSDAASMEMHTVARASVKECTDEWAPFTMIYGMIMDNGDHMQTIPGISHSLISDLGDKTQGSCRTFVWWYSMHSEADALIKAISKDPGCNLSCYPCHSSHPVEFLVLSDEAIARLKQSSFLFARKFAGSVMTLDQFKRLILS
mmetsp:Transcript_17698/g.41041  ORF Transcript_17698/g.41041 Transcript_17698/m.41041 type:complete len:525 (-) Transcript_17698:41-1615(-)